MPGIRDINIIFISILYFCTCRCHARFPVPAIFYRGKYVCRSGTLSRGYEIIYRSATLGGRSEEEENFEEVEKAEPMTTDEWAVCNRARNEDIALLKCLNVDTIVDLMVENMKEKYGLK